jgi:predicted transcriptional regulator
MKEKSNYLTVTQAARFVGVSQSAVSQRVTSGKLKTTRIYGVDMVHVASCRAWIKERTQQERTSPSTGVRHGKSTKRR